ncbi:MAG: hypothetical protein AABO58_21470 [Acidobacteriota bacterium]
MKTRVASTLAMTILLSVTSATATVIQTLGGAPQVLIPAAGSTAGANGTFFHSDIYVSNRTSRTQTVRFDWLPQAGNGGTTMQVEMAAGSVIRSTDFVRDVLNVSGLGAILVTGITSTGAVDRTAWLRVSSRIWTTQPGSTGTTSQSFPAIDTDTISTHLRACVSGAGGSENGANYRVNVGVVNLDPKKPQTFFAYIDTGSGTPTGQTFIVPPLSMQQISMGNGLAPTTDIVIENITGQQSDAWIAYGSTVDNVTGDAWSEMAVPGPPWDY